jgi:hypothetical protein
MRPAALRRFAQTRPKRAFTRLPPRFPPIPRPDLSYDPFEPGARTTVSQVKAKTETAQEVDMTRRDQKLLDRQLRGLCIPERHDGAMILAIVAIFLAGMFLGNLRSEAGATVHFNTMETALSAPSAANPALTVLR